MRFKARSSLDTYTLRSQRTALLISSNRPATDPNFDQIISNFRPPIRSSQLYRRYKVRLRKRKGSETQPRVEQPSRQWRKARVDAPQRSSRALAHAIDTLDSRGFHVPARRHDTRAEQDRLRTRPTETGRGSASRGSSSRRREHGPNRHRRFDVVDTFLPPDRPRGNPSFGSRIILVLFSHSVTAIERVIRVNRSRWDVSRAPKCDSPVVCSSFDFGQVSREYRESTYWDGPTRIESKFDTIRLRGYSLLHDFHTVPRPYARAFRIATRNAGWIDPFPVFSHLRDRIIWKNKAAIPLRYPVDASPRPTLGLTRDRHILLSRNALLYAIACEKIVRGGDRKGGKLQREGSLEHLSPREIEGTV